MRSIIASTVLLLCVRTIYSAVVEVRQANEYQPSEDESNDDRVKRKFLLRGDFKEELDGAKDVLDYAGNGWKLQEIEEFGLLSVLKSRVRHWKLRYAWILKHIRSKLQTAQDDTDKMSHPCVGSHIEIVSRDTADKWYKNDDYIRNLANAYRNEENGLRYLANAYESKDNSRRNLANVYDNDNNNPRYHANVYGSGSNNLRNLQNFANAYDRDQGDLYCQDEINYEQMNDRDLTNRVAHSRMISALRDEDVAEESSPGLGKFERETRRGRLHSDSGYGSRIDTAGNVAGSAMAAERIFGMFGPGRKKRKNEAVTRYSSNGIVGTKRGGDRFMLDYGYGSRIHAGSRIARYIAAKNMFGDLGRRR